MTPRALVLTLAGFVLLAVGWTQRAMPNVTPAAATPAIPVPSAGPPSAPAADRPRAASLQPAILRHLIVGGGATPESTEVSLEQDVRLASSVLAGPGRLLFAGGRGSRVVRVLSPELAAPGLLARLGDVFQPRLGRSSRYRALELDAEPADLEAVESALEDALGQGREPLLVYLATHGERGEHASDNYVSLWGGGGLTARALSEIHDTHPRPLRLVVASCYSGGFAEMVFTGADPERGPSDAPRCGLFAGTWDRQTTGCDPSPDRHAQEGYSLHLWSALQGRDRAGAPLPLAELDVDGDGRVSLLEAHTRAVIASHSVDVPTTTSERYLRHVDPQRAAPEPSLLPEEARVVERLGAELGLDGRQAVDAHLSGLEERLRALDDELARTDEVMAKAASELSAELLARWPVLDDPYHPDFAELVRAQASAIEGALDTSAAGRRFTAAASAVRALEERSWSLQAQEARVLRLWRALESLERAAGLRRAGGEAWRRFQALRACERFVPPAPAGAATRPDG